MTKTTLTSIYLVLIFSLVPIIQWLIIYARDISDHDFGKWYHYMVIYRIFLSGPALILSGVCLMLIGERWIHRIVGIFSFLIGIYWTIEILTTPL